MKTAVCIILALLLGLVLGSWSVKADLRRTQQEVSKLKQELLKRPAGKRGGLDGITSMLKIPETTDAPSSQPVAAAAPTNAVPASVSAPTADTHTVTFTLGTPGTNTHRHRHPGAGRDGLRRQLETAAGAWKVRSDLARAGFVSNVTDTDEQAAQFDVAMAAMNMRLGNSVRTWVDYVKQQQDVTPETGIRIMNDLSGAMVQAYSDLDRTMPAGWREKAGPKFQVFDFVNPEVVMPLAEVEDVFRRTENANSNPDATHDREP